MSEIRKYKTGDYVFIFETVTGNSFGEYATVIDYLEDEHVYIVKSGDGLLLKGAEEQICFR